MTNLSVIAEQIEHISRVANGWCNFALVCGCIGFALSLVAAILLIKKTKVDMPGNSQKTWYAKLAFFQKRKTISTKNIKEEENGSGKTNNN